MTAITVKNLMLYCPKCQQTYEEGTLRFCSNDGARLISSPSANPLKKSGVFSNLLGRNTPIDDGAKDEKLAAIPRFVQPETAAQQVFIAPPVSKIFKTEEPELEIEQPAQSKKAEPQIEPEKSEKHFLTVKPIPPRTIRSSEIPSGTASVGDRKTDPIGRQALNWRQPEVLLGQTIKGRYRIVELFGQDESSLSYLAEDKIVPNKKVTVVILMNGRTNDDLESKILAEERVSLSHINHPNIISVIDSGELLEGNPFIITEFAAGKSVKDMLRQTGQFNAARIARIIRQASSALSEAHQNGILHRNLKPENIILTVSETGQEQVKLTNFGVFRDEINEENAPYQAPELLEGETATFACDVYSLGVIAYQMLTNRLPFNASSASDLLRVQRKGLNVYPTNLRLDLPPLTDQILEKALSFSPDVRYPKARDFGDALFNALTTAAPWEKKSEKAEEEVKITSDEKQIDEEKTENPALVFALAVESDSKDEIVSESLPPQTNAEAAIIAANEAPEKTDKIKESKNLEISSAKTNEALPWEKRSPEPVKPPSRSWILFSVLGLALLLIACWAVWHILLNRPNNLVVVEQKAVNNIKENAANQAVNAPKDVLPSAEVNEIPPPRRSIDQPPNTAYFENTKQDLSADLAKKFLGFSLYYPKDWVKKESAGNFLDISKNSADGIMVKQMIITRYDSKGTFNQDKELFDSLAAKSNEDLKKVLPDYEVISAQESQIQDGRWKVYEVKFKNVGKTENDGEITLYGRRLWIPIQRQGAKSGFVITMLETSLSPDVKSIEDVGVNDELSKILETFEPEQAN